MEHRKQWNSQSKHKQTNWTARYAGARDSCISKYHIAQDLSGALLLMHNKKCNCFRDSLQSNDHKEFFSFFDESYLWSLVTFMIIRKLSINWSITIEFAREQRPPSPYPGVNEAHFALAKPFFCCFCFFVSCFGERAAGRLYTASSS